LLGQAPNMKELVWKQLDWLEGEGCMQFFMNKKGKT